MSRGPRSEPLDIDAGEGRVEPREPLAGGEPPERVSLAKAGKLAGVSDKTLRRWIEQGRLRATKEEGDYGPQWWVARADLDAALAAQRPAAAAPTAPSADLATIERGAAAMRSLESIERTSQDMARRAQLIERQTALLPDVARELGALRESVETLRSELDAERRARAEAEARRARWWWPFGR